MHPMHLLDLRTMQRGIIYRVATPIGSHGMAYSQGHRKEGGDGVSM